jgi:hypothetical protein
MRNVKTATEINNIRRLEEELDCEGRNAELNFEELESVAGGRVYRITNVRVNAQPLAGGSASGASPVQAS